MALIKCIECGSMVSDKASSCPHCGCPIKQSNTNICIECGTRIPANMSECPHCGCPTGNAETVQEVLYEENENKPKWWIWALLAVLLCLLGGGCYLLAQSSKNEDAQDNTQGSAVDNKEEITDAKDAVVELTPTFIKAIEQYDQLSSFSEGYAAVKKGNKWGYINTKGEEVLPCVYDDAGAFGDGLAAIQKNNKWGYIDTKGKVVIPINIEAMTVNKFSEGLALIVTDGEGPYEDPSKYFRFYVIDTKGNKIFGDFIYIEEGEGTEYPTIQTYVNERIYIPISSDNFAVYNKQGKKIAEENVSQREKYINKYKTPYTVTTKEHGEGYPNWYTYGVKDAAGNTLLPAIYDNIGHELYYEQYLYAENGVFLVKMDEIGEDVELGYGDQFESPNTKSYYGYADLKGHDTFSNALKERCKQSKERAYYTIVEEMAEKDAEAKFENSENTRSNDEYSASSAPQWVQGTWTHDLTAPMVGRVASYKLVVSGNTMTFYRNGEMQYRDNFTYQNGRLVGQHGSFVLKENLQRLADATGTFNKEGGSGSNKLDGVRFSSAYDVIGYLSGLTFHETSSGGLLQIRQDGVYVNGRCMTGAPSVSNFTSTSAVVRASLIPTGTLIFNVDAKKGIITDNSGMTFR